ASAVSVAGTTAYTLDAANRTARIESPAGTLRFGHCAWSGLVASITNVNGLVASYAYDILDRVTNIAWTVDGAPLGGFSYTYDVLGRITARHHALGADTFDRAYAYDGLDRLAADGPVSYTWDAAGNRTAKRGGAEGDVAYALGAGDRLASWTGGAYTYDAAGNVTRIVRDGRPTLDLVWNGQYQLVSVSTNGVLAESYAYDALGRRASTTTREGTVRHVYGRTWQVLADLDGAGNVLRSYTWGGGVDNLLAARVGAKAYATLTDTQGTVWGLVGGDGEIAARWTYDAWGNVLSEEVTDPDLAAFRYRFQGREYSAATGLVNFRARWYDPGTGRWLSKDPIRLQGGVNLYAFCSNSPVCVNDPFGEMRVPAPGWHRSERDALNFPLPSSPPEPGSGWKELPESMSVYHDNGKGKPERKFIHPDGREAVYDGDTEGLITNQKYKGTYNYVNPPTGKNSAGEWLLRAVGHFISDMLPYYIWGN
ncbi:MAG: RHS repeat-associated core domain-containing protein, partial [bacterium]|nr:RHS repeat-associated core domain-containing protein [bacterium]